MGIRAFFRRRTILVDREVQYRLLRYNAVHFLIIAAFVSAAFFVPLFHQLQIAGHTWVQKGHIARQILFLHGHVWPVLLLLLVLLPVHSLVISHKIVGPLRKFRMAVHSFARGKPWRMPPIRKDDILNRDLHALGRSLSLLQEYLGRVQAEQDEMDRLVKSIMEKLDATADSSEIRSDFLRVSHQWARVQREIHNLGGRNQ